MSAMSMRVSRAPTRPPASWPTKRPAHLNAAQTIRTNSTVATPTILGFPAALQLRLLALDAFQDQLMRVGGVAPAHHLDPFVRLQILVVLEEVLDLLQRDLGQIAVGLHPVIA